MYSTMTNNNIKNNKTKTTTTIIAALVIGMMLISPMTVMPSVNAQQQTIPANAIRTVDGGWITPLQTVDDKGRPLTIHYEPSPQVFGYLPPSCSGPYSSQVEQEGGSWSYPTQNNNAIGFETTWNMPTGNVTGGANGVYYNPVNFNYTGSMTGNTYPYTFFQVDWGIGTGSTGIYKHWSYTMAYKSGSNIIYNQYGMSGITESQGSTYTVQSMLEPSPMASNQYVVQVTLGSNSWIYSNSLTYTPQLGHLTKLMSFQDEYAVAHGTTNLGSDSVSSPTIVLDNSNVLGYDTTSVTGVSQYTGYGAYSGSTYQILTSSVGTKTIADSAGCPSW